jgi:hypothetical protein
MLTIRSKAAVSALLLLTVGCRTTASDSDAVPLAIWSSSDSEADTPESAADAAVRALIGVTPVLGEYMAGDNRSGEVIVFSPGDAVPVERSLLLLRQIGPDDRWSVIGAINEAMEIDEPASGSVVSPGLVVVAGRARGFESLVVVGAHRIGDETDSIDEVITSGGSLEESTPFRVVLDLRDTKEGDVIAIVVRGGVGLEDDPGEFSAIPIRIGE